MFISICIGVRQIDLSSGRADIGKGIQDMGELVGREVLRLVVSAVNCLDWVSVDQSR
jgi:hypothetical protein